VRDGEIHSTTVADAKVARALPEEGGPAILASPDPEHIFD